VNFATRPAQRAGSHETWDRAEAALAAAAAHAGVTCRVKAGEGAFYGPKLEFELGDRLGRRWQCGTIQLDFVLPERFDLRYDDSSGGQLRPAMLHRAMVGSLERFLGILLEHHEGRVPGWLAPEQVRVVPVHPDQREYAVALVRRLRRHGLRAAVDDSNQTLSKRIAEAHAWRLPLVWIVGAREAERLRVSERGSDREQRSLPVVEAVERALVACACPVSQRDFAGQRPVLGRWRRNPFGLLDPPRADR
jgi:threonyl-tRNA synthetase